MLQLLLGHDQVVFGLLMHVVTRTISMCDELLMHNETLVKGSHIHTHTHTKGRSDGHPSIHATLKSPEKSNKATSF